MAAQNKPSGTILSPNPDRWVEEKKRLEACTLQERREGYSCGKDFVMLSEIPTLKDLPPPTLAIVEEERIKEDLFKKLDMQSFKGAGDLSMKISTYAGDITKLEVDAIVNACNNSIMGGGGVDGAIHRAAGPFLRAENFTLNGCEDGEAKISCGYKLPARYVISTVGPMGEHPKVLENAYLNSLKVMKANNLRSIAFPCISTGIYGYPNESACTVGLRMVRYFLERNKDSVDRVVFCLFKKEDVAIYRDRLHFMFPAEAE